MLKIDFPRRIPYPKTFDMVKKDYCPHCRKRTPHIKSLLYKICKRCGRQYKI